MHLLISEAYIAAPSCSAVLLMNLKETCQDIPLVMSHCIHLYQVDKIINTTWCRAYIPFARILSSHGIICLVLYEAVSVHQEVGIDVDRWTIHRYCSTRGSCLITNES